VTTLVVATDGSDLAIQAAVAGISLTKQADRLLVVSAVELIDPVVDATGHAGPTMTYEQVKASHLEMKAEGEAAVAATADALRDVGCEPEQIETLVIEGDPGAALCRLAADVGASALIVGSRGRGGLKRALLGSVSDYIVRHAPCSVVVSKHREP
jgi:nucleotide-binding universal stress UspA family protein